MGKIDLSEGPFPFPTKWNTKQYLEMLEITKRWFIDCKNILDIGCGRGEAVEYLQNKNNKCIGIEIRNFETWRKLNKEFYVYDGINFPVSGKKFDGILLNNVLEHIKDKKRFVDKLRTISKKNTSFVLLLPTAKWKLLNLLRLPIFLIGFIRGYGLGNDYWFIHEPEIYGWNYFAELKDYRNWKKILQKYFLIEDECLGIKGKNIMFKCKLRSEEK